MIRAVFNRKGGVGKSTLACNLAAAAAKVGRSALIVDLDPQSKLNQLPRPRRKGRRCRRRRVLPVCRRICLPEYGAHRFCQGN